MPGFIKPQLATLKSKAPKGEQWIHEIKYDGYRVQLHVDSGKKKVFTRNGLDWAKRFSTIAGAFDVPGQAIIDGEVVSSMKAAPTSPNCRPNSRRAGKTGLCSTPLTFFGVMAM